MRPPHKKAHPVCEYGASTWGECDKAVASAYVDWQATQQVILAARIVRQGRAGAFFKENGEFGQLVQILAGKREGFTDKKGNPSSATFVLRLQAAIARITDEGLAGYNLYTWPEVPADISQ